MGTELSHISAILKVKNTLRPFVDCYRMLEELERDLKFAEPED